MKEREVVLLLTRGHFLPPNSFIMGYFTIHIWLLIDFANFRFISDSDKARWGMIGKMSPSWLRLSINIINFQKDKSTWKLH